MTSSYVIDGVGRFNVPFDRPPHGNLPQWGWGLAAACGGLGKERSEALLADDLAPLDPRRARPLTCDSPRQPNTRMRSTPTDRFVLGGRASRFTLM